MYDVALTKRAEKQLDKIPNVNYKSIVKHLKELAENPRPTGCKKLVGFDYLYRIRVGNYRVIYRIEDDRLIVYL